MLQKKYKSSKKRDTHASNPNGSNPVDFLYSIGDQRLKRMALSWQEIEE
jgi:hypothetical protein